MSNNGNEHRLHGHAVLEHRLEPRSVGSACAVGISEGFCYGPSVAGASVLNFACLGGDVVQHHCAGTSMRWNIAHEQGRKSVYTAHGRAALPRTQCFLRTYSLGHSALYTYYRC